NSGAARPLRGAAAERQFVTHRSDFTCTYCRFRTSAHERPDDLLRMLVSSGNSRHGFQRYRSALAELGFLHQMLDDLLLFWVEPTCHADDEKRKWIETCSHPRRLSRRSSHSAYRRKGLEFLGHYRVAGASSLTDRESRFEPSTANCSLQAFGPHQSLNGA